MMNEWHEIRQWRKGFEGFALQVSQFDFREDPGFYEFPCIWNTYICLRDFIRWSKNGELCKPYVEKNPLVDLFWGKEGSLDDVPWNGGVTLWEETTDKLGARILKVGDDYAHIWDSENRKFELYNLEYMQREAEIKAMMFQKLTKRLQGERWQLQVEE